MRRLFPVLLLAIAATAAVTPPPLLSRASYAFSIVSEHTPRMLVAGRVASVRVQLRNDGTRAWDLRPRVSLSYHWVTLTGTRLSGEGDRSPITRVVNPGETIALDAQVTGAPGGGIYRLEWDMVEEGVTWFSEHDPVPPPRPTVLVIPSAASLVGDLSFPLPAALAVFCLAWIWLTRARHADSRVFPVLAALDVVWCTVVLFFKQVVLLTETRLDVTAHVLFLCLCTAAFVPLLLLLVVPQRQRAWFAWAAAFGGTLVVLADGLYYRYFGDVISSTALLATSQAGRLRETILSLVAPRDAWLFLDLLLAIPMVAAVARLPQHRSAGPHRAAVATALLTIVCAGAPLAIAGIHGAEDDVRFRNLTAVQRIGPFGYHADDAWVYLRTRIMRPRLTAAQMVAVRDYFARRAPQRAGVGPWFGAARGRNVIVILVESLQQFVVGLRVNGEEITPTLNRLRTESVWFSRVVDQAAEGRTSDAELINAASLLPLAHGAAAYQYQDNHFVALPALLAARGYQTASAIAFDGTFWNRVVMHPAYGFSHSWFAPDFTPGETVGWGLNDADFLAQMEARLGTLRPPFFVWLLTLSLHHPFDSFPASLNTLNLGPWNDTRLGNYLAAMHLFDDGLARLLDGLAARHLLDNTLLVIEGDHEAGIAWRNVAEAAGYRHDEPGWYLADSVPLIIRVPGGKGPHGEMTIRAGQTDVAPTLLALLGFDPAPLPWIGRNLLGQPVGEPVLRRYGDWLDENHLFLTGRSYSSKMTCFDLATRAQVPLEGCREAGREAARQLEMSQRVLTNDLQRELLSREGVRK